jgi:hypothetical protein
MGVEHAYRTIQWLTVVSVVITTTGCAAPDRAYEALERAGYTKIELGGYAWFACAEDDFFATRFNAIASDR